MELVLKKPSVLARLGQTLTDDRQAKVSRQMVASTCLEEQIRQCLYAMRRNQMLFDLETEPELIDELVYEYQAIQSRYRYLQRKARKEGLKTIL